MGIRIHKRDGEVIIFTSVADAFRYAENRDDVTKIVWEDDVTAEVISFVRNPPFGWSFKSEVISNPNQGALNV